MAINAASHSINLPDEIAESMMSNSSSTAASSFQAQNNSILISRITFGS